MGIYREISGKLYFIICGADMMHHIFHANSFEFDVCPYLCHQLVGAISFVHVSFSSRDAPSIGESAIESLLIIS